MGLLSPRDPLALFASWMKLAQEKSGLRNPNAFCLSTLGENGFPDGRMLLLKSFGPEGFTFYTNLQSAKGRALLAHAKAAMTFYWDKLGRQVRVQGPVKIFGGKEADSYFHSRPRLSQLGAWASLQSQPLTSRATLLARVAKFTTKFRTKEIPRPPHWMGIHVIPNRIEFWTERPFRLHDRFLYIKRGNKWKRERLYP